jgi:hypothetical protein
MNHHLDERTLNESGHELDHELSDRVPCNMEQNKALPQFIHRSTQQSSTYLLFSLSSSSVNVPFYIRHYEASLLIVRLEQLQLLQKKKGPKPHILHEYSNILDEKHSSPNCC